MITLNKVQVYPNLSADNAAKVKTRVKLDENNRNKTSSLTDPVLAEFRDHQLKPVEVAQLKNWDFVLDKSSSTIQQHLEKRVFHLFLQAVVCYQTGYLFEEGHTVHQGFGAHPIEYEDGKLEFQAAHSPTLPCIYASSPNSNQKVVYLYRSGCYDEGNGTIDLVKAVNDADRAIDEKYASSLLRKKAIKLLNLASSGKLTPEQVSKEFALKLIEEIDHASEREQNNQVHDVLHLYRDHAELLWSYVDNPEYIDQWLNLNLDDPILHHANQITEQLKQGGMVAQTDILALIKRKVDHLPVMIRQKEHQENNVCRPPFHFLDLYHFNLLKRFKGEDLQIIEEATGIKYQNLATKVSHFKRTNKTIGLLAKNAAKIDELTQEIMPLIAKAQGKDVDSEQIVGLSQTRKTCLRPDVWRLRYQMIREDQKAQSVVKSKIEQVLNEIKQTSKAHYIEDFYYLSLLNQAKSSQTQQRLSKLLNLSSLQLHQNIREIKINEAVHSNIERYAREVSRISGLINDFCGRRKVSTLTEKSIQGSINQIYAQISSGCKANREQIKFLFYKRLFERAEKAEEKVLLTKLLSHTEKQIDEKIAVYLSKKVNNAEQHVKNQAQKVQDTVNVLLHEIANLNRKTSEFRRKLMTELRLSNGMSQDYFKAVYKKNYPRYPMSAGTMSNLENGAKLITADIIEQISDIFCVNKNLFYPYHFAV